MNKWFPWYLDMIEDNYKNLNKDNVIYWYDDYKSLIITGYIGTNWFIHKDCMVIEVFDEKDERMYVNEDQIIEMNWCE